MGSLKKNCHQLCVLDFLDKLLRVKAL